MDRAEAGARLGSALKAAGISQAQFSRDVGCSTAAVNRAIKGGQWPTMEMLAVLTRRLHVSASWIITGEGSSLLSEDTPNANLHQLLDRALVRGDASRIRGFLEAMAGADAPRSTAKTA